jgi:mannose-6-phosphate isomerase-like protein (cupin superfamily)
MLSEDATDSLTVVNKCWGKEYLLDVTKNYAMKKLFVEAGKNLSLQYHVHKSETWHIVDGSGIARVDGKEFRVNIGDTIRIPAGTIHQVKAITNLVIIESSTTELDDIVRIKRSF